jgi:hypothetical protein
MRALVVARKTEQKVFFLTKSDIRGSGYREQPLVALGPPRKLRRNVDVDPEDMAT